MLTARVLALRCGRGFGLEPAQLAQGVEGIPDELVGDAMIEALCSHRERRMSSASATRQGFIKVTYGLFGSGCWSRVGSRLGSGNG